MKIIKASGEAAAYDASKIAHSLERAGASPEMIQQVLAETEKELFEGIHTNAMYKLVFKKLKKLSHSTAGKYHLKKAIMELGPTGFPFEKFIAALLEAEGYQTATNQIVQGHCVTHEVDVIAKKEAKQFIMECKFHSDGGNICGVKIALYVYARFLDIAKFHRQQFDQGWLVTNTRLSTDAEQYGKCVGMGLLSWNFPKGNSLRERIDRHGLYPITCLTTLSSSQKQLLLKKMVVLCQTVCEIPNTLDGLGLSHAKKSKVMEEVQMICRGCCKSRFGGQIR